MTSTSTDSEARRGTILRQYLEATDRAVRYRLAREWLDAGGREMMEQAFRDGLRPLKVRADEKA